MNITSHQNIRDMLEARKTSKAISKINRFAVTVLVSFLVVFYGFHIISYIINQ